MLLPANDLGTVEVPVAGYYPGETTNERITAMFGDLLPEEGPLTEEQFQTVIDRCVTNNWIAWEMSWRIWRKNGVV